MKFYIYTLSMLLLHGSSCLAQNLIGTRLMAMGGDNAAISDNWNFTGNFKNEDRLNTPKIAIGYAKYFYGDELSNQQLKFILPVKNYEAGISFKRYGITEFNRLTAGASLAKNFGDKFSIGLRANFHQLKIQNYGSTTGFSIDIGAMYHINNQITIGLNINNPSKQTYQNSNASISIPSLVNFGIAYQASNKILIATNLSKNFNEKYDVGLGLDYKLIEILSLRGGISMKPFKQYGGIGIDYKKLNLDLAIENDPHLGYSSQIGIAYAF
jgi:hypothetical protein